MSMANATWNRIEMENEKTRSATVNSLFTFWAARK
jgi:hypothetical protein